MKRICVLMLISLFSLVSTAQSVIKIDLDDWKGKNSSLPFEISAVEDNRQLPERIGILQLNKNKSTTIKFAGNSVQLIQKFINKQFSQGKEMNVRMEIATLDIETVEIRKKEVSTLIFACNFYKVGEGNSEPLYKFNARNSITKRKGLKLAVTNYVGRAITSGILNFRKSYLKHPEWQKENANAPDVNIKKKIINNDFLRGDTIALDGKYQLQLEDFAASVQEEEEDDAYSAMVITYSLAADDEGDKIALNIYPKAFFLRSQSWSKGADAKNDWQSHQQLLFDLASYHSLLFKKELDNFNFSAGFYRSELNTIYNKMTEAYFNEMDLLQEETKFGTNVEKEIAWRQKVNSYLGKK